MVRIREEANCDGVRVFLWNERLTRNQISQGEALCVFQIKSTYMRVQPCVGGSCSEETARRSPTIVIPFDKSKLVNKDLTLASTLTSSTLQFLPETIKYLSEQISSALFTAFDFSLLLPTYVIGLEITHTRFMDFTDIDLNVSPDFKQYPPPPPCFRPFEKDWDEEDEYFINPTTLEEHETDPYHCYTDDVLDYVNALRDYAGEAGMVPTKPPIAPNVPRGLVQIRPSLTKPNICDYMDDGDLCPVCHEEMKDAKDVTITPCFHAFHITCLLPWISIAANKTCPTCRAVYPWHCDLL